MEKLSLHSRLCTSYFNDGSRDAKGLALWAVQWQSWDCLTSQVLVWSPFLGLRLKLGVLREVDITLSVATLSTPCLHVLSRFIIFHMESWNSGKIK